MTNLSRRRFLTQSAGLGLGLTAGRYHADQLTGKAVAANDRLGVACIGVRGQGGCAC